MKNFLNKNKSSILLSSFMLPLVYYYPYPKKNNEINNILKNDISGKTVLSVSKKVSNHWDNNKINVYENEKKWLKILKDTDIIAKPIHFDDENRIITTEYVGERVNNKNLPKNWEEQRDIIISTLKNNNCSHNDIKPSEIIVYKDKIKLVDFGWAHELNEEVPKYWPKGLGAEFKCNSNNKEFDDKCSFNKSINFIKK